MATPLERPRTRMPDPWVMALAALLATSGVVISGSARAFQEAIGAGAPVGIARSMVHLGLGLLAMAATLIPDYRKLAGPAAAWVLLGVTTALLVAALCAPAVGATHRWIRVAGVSIQPSELAKVTLVILVATTLVRVGSEIRTFAGLCRPLALGGWIAALILAGKDLGTPVLMFGATLVLAVAAGARVRHVAAICAAGAVVLAASIWLEPYRVGRVLGFTHALWFSPDALNDIPYQLRQSLLAIGSGGVLGKGFGLSTQKAFFLPEVDNDFIFAVIGEELGLLGAGVVLAAFLVLAWRGLRIAERAPDELGRLIALGATWLLCGQALCHMGVTMGLLPTKGLTLPFFSTGGWSLIVSCALAGLLMNVSLRRRPDGV